MYNLSKKIYLHISEQLINEIKSDTFTYINVDFFDNEYQILFTATLFPKLEKIDYPEGETIVITDIIPVWWSLQSIYQGVDQSNDFDFNTLKEIVCHR